MTATREAFLDACAQDEGYHEDPAGSNRTKFAAIAGHANGAPWCATFTVAKAKQVGLALPAAVAKTAYTPAAVNAWKQAGRWHTDPQPGDFVYFQFDADPQVDHVGIVESVRADGSLVTIEGNTSTDDHGSQSNGGQVARRHRARRLAVGFGRPEFAPAAKPPPEPPKAAAHAPVHPWPGHPTARGSKDRQTVEVIQQRLKVNAGASLGTYGPKTVAAVRAFQKAHNLPQSGTVDRATWRVMFDA